MEYLKKLIDFCKENDIEFVAVTTPVPIATLKDHSDNYNAAWKYFGKFFEEQGVDYINFNTQYFKAVQEDKKLEVGEVLREVYEALTEKGYNPINQIVGYLLSEDPTYITNHNNARSLICKIDRDELMQELVQFYLDN